MLLNIKKKKSKGFPINFINFINFFFVLLKKQKIEKRKNKTNYRGWSWRVEEFEYKGIIWLYGDDN